MNVKMEDVDVLVLGDKVGLSQKHAPYALFTSSPKCVGKGTGEVLHGQR
jgi:hypothetical protein